MNAINNDFNSFKLFGIRNLSENLRKQTNSFPRKIQVHTNSWIQFQEAHRSENDTVIGLDSVYNFSAVLSWACINQVLFSPLPPKVSLSRSLTSSMTLRPVVSPWSNAPLTPTPPPGNSIFFSWFQGPSLLLGLPNSCHFRVSDTDSANWGLHL